MPGREIASQPFDETRPVFRLRMAMLLKFHDIPAYAPFRLYVFNVYRTDRIVPAPFPFQADFVNQFFVRYGWICAQNGRTHFMIHFVNRFHKTIFLLQLYQILRRVAVDAVRPSIVADRLRRGSRAKRRGNRRKHHHQFLCHFSVPFKSFSVYSPTLLHDLPMAGFVRAISFLAATKKRRVCVIDNTLAKLHLLQTFAKSIYNVEKALLRSPRSIDDLHKIGKCSHRQNWRERLSSRRLENFNAAWELHRTWRDNPFGDNLSSRRLDNYPRVF